jgi:hypothetical protein
LPVIDSNSAHLQRCETQRQDFLSVFELRSSRNTKRDGCAPQSLLMNADD